MPSRFVAPKRLETLEDVRKALQSVQEQFDANGISKARGQLVTKSTTLVSGEFVRLAPRQGQTLIAKLPKATAENIGSQIAISLEHPNGTLKIASEKPDTIAGLFTATFTIASLILLQSNGTDQWVLLNQLPTNSPAAPDLSAEYVLGAADASLPNGRVATDTTEIDADLTVPNVIGWVLRSASVVFAKLQDLTGLSVLGRAANSTGVMAAITASTARHTLTLNQAGTALAWGYPIRAQVNSGALTDGYSINVIDGTHTTAAMTPSAGGGFIEQYSVNTTTLAAALAGAGMTATAGVMNVIGAAGGYITVGANDVAWQGFDLAINGVAASVGWKGIDVFDSGRITWGVAASPVSGLIQFTPDIAIASVTPNYLGSGLQLEVTGTGTIAALAHSTDETCFMFSGAAPVLQGLAPALRGFPHWIQKQGAASTLTMLDNNGTASATSRFAFYKDKDVVIQDDELSGFIMVDITSGATDDKRWLNFTHRYPFCRTTDMSAGDQIQFDGTDWLAQAFIRFAGATTTASGDIRKDTTLDIKVLGNTLSVNSVGSSTLTVANTITAAGASVALTAGTGGITMTPTTLVDITGAAAFLRMAEVAASTPSVSAGSGMFWTQNTAATRPMFTDDVEQDQPLGYAAQDAATSITAVQIPVAGTTLATATYVANELRAGSTFRFFAQVFIARGATATATNVTLEFRVGGTSRFAIAAVALATAASNHTAWIEGYFSVLGAPGGTAPITVSGWSAHDLVTAGTVVESSMAPLPSIVLTAATNGSLTLDLRVFASVTVAGVTASPIHAHIQRIN